MADDQTRVEINRLYWGSEAPVAEIAEGLGVSRRALYDSIDPQPAGASCPDCGSALEFRNRTAAERREASCPDCGTEETLGPAGGGDAGEEEPQVEQLARGARLSPMPERRVPGVGGTALSGALLAGLAAGALLGYAVRRG